MCVHAGASAAQGLPGDSTRTLNSELSIRFPINSGSIIPDFEDNAAALDSLAGLFGRATADSLFSIRSISVTGMASPDGDLKSNIALADRRRQALCDYIADTYPDIAAQALEHGFARVPWPEFRAAVSAAGFPGAGEVLAIASWGDDNSPVDSRRRMNRIKRLRSGAPWQLIKSDILPALRSSVVVSIASELIPATPVAEPEPEPESAPLIVEETIVETVAPEQTGQTEQSPCPVHGWHLSTNALEWALLISNITGEYDMAAHWSAALSLHFSALNYGTSTRKFRTFIFRPEVRFWPGNCHKGFFLDAHVQMAAYNFALSHWDYRIQDVGGKHPALGGGIGVGYRLPISRNGHWALQAQVGAGVYALRYDRFVNRPGGQLVDTRKRTFFGVDNVAISVVYNFLASSR